MSQFPTWAAGQKVVAATLMAGTVYFIQKASNTSRTSVTAMADDPELTMQLAGNSVYSVEFFLYYASGSTGKFTTSWTVPSGLNSAGRAALGLDSSVSNSTPEGVMRSGVHGYATGVTYGDRAGTNSLYAMENAVISTGSIGGTLALGWTQSASSATATTLAAGSWMRVQQMG